MEIVGYSDRLCAAPGETIAFMVSTSQRRYRTQLVRLVHGDPNPDGPGFEQEILPSPLDGERDGRVQELSQGSYAVAPMPPLGPSFRARLNVCPTAPGGREQVLVAQGSWALVLDDAGAPALRIGDELVGCGVPMRAWEWYELELDIRGGSVHLRQHALRTVVVDGEAEVERSAPTLSPLEGSLSLACRFVGGHPRDHFNGRLEQPRISSDDGVVAAWDFALEIPTTRIVDVSGHDRHGRLVNMPLRGVTGSRFAGHSLSWQQAPEEYAAIHFHDDDLADAGWSADFDYTVPAETGSGVYAVHLETDGGEDYLPFFVRPARGTATADIAFLAPTFSYLAYANEHYSWASDFAVWAPGDVLARVTDADRYMREERLLSLYDFHSDGTGNCLSSHRRPILSLRPKWHMPLISAPHQLGADLHLLDWLEQKGFARDVVTDHDLHAEGVELLQRYRVILTGTHPEYWSGQMLDALERYLAAGGRLMYLGGNGFWWVTSVHPAAPHVIEIRRGLSGSRPWTSLPGEVHHSGTGEFGGQWRYRGRPPQRLVGVGFTSQGSDASRPYRRLEGSRDPRAAWIFDGVGDDEPIGDFGLVLGAAGGAEIDRADLALGTPPHALVLARADGYTDMYQAAMDDTLFYDSKQGGTQSALVRADMVFFELPGGGAVFAPGSISWCGSLSYAGYENNVSRITENVLRRFRDPTPFSPPG